MAQFQPTSIWARVDEQRAARTPTPASPPRRRFRWVIDAILPLTLAVIMGVVVLVPSALSYQARVSLFTFALAVILWSTTQLNAAYVALAAALLQVLAGGSAQDQFFNALASDVIWLMIGAFVLGGAVQQTGLAERLTQVVVVRARTVGESCGSSLRCSSRYRSLFPPRQAGRRW